MFAQESNKENWEQLTFVLQERDKPTFIVIGFDSYATQKKVFGELRNEFSNYKFHEMDLSSLNIVSLNKIFTDKLPKTVLNSGPSEYIVSVFGLENSLFTVQNGKIEQSSLIAELNFEREILFQRFPFITIIWTDSYTVGKLKKEAKDLWDWISYYFEFNAEFIQVKDSQVRAVGDNAKVDVGLHFGSDKLKYPQDNGLPRTKIFISYAREDYGTAKRLYNDLKRNGFQAWLAEEDLLPGQNWKSAISKTIRESSVFLALLSSKAVNQRGYIHKEMKIALDILDELPPDSIFIIPVYLDSVHPEYEILRDIAGINLYDSYYEQGLRKILTALHYKEKNKITSTDGKSEHFELNKKDISETINRIIKLREKYDSIRLDDTSRERVVKEKINIQKLLGQEYMKLEDDEKAEQSFRIALALCEQTEGLEYEKDEISFLLRQIHYEPIIQPNEINI